MSTLLKTRLIALVAALASALGASAQQQIESIVQQIVDSNQCEVIYSETRDPETHEIIASSHVINSTDMNLYDKLFRAIQEERKHSVAYSQVGKDVISISLIDKGATVSFSLIKDEDGSWMLSTSRQPDSEKKNKTKVTRTKTQQRPADSSTVVTGTTVGHIQALLA